MRKRMRTLAFTALTTCCCACTTPDKSAMLPNGVLPNGWGIAPAGTTVKLPGDMPLKIVVTDEGRSALIVTGGYHDHAIDVVDLVSPSLHQHLALGKAWAGLATVGRSGVVYVAGGGPAGEVQAELAKRGELESLAPEVRASLSTPVLRLVWRAGQLAPAGGLSIVGLDDEDRFTAGMAADKAGNVFVCNLANDTVYKLDPERAAVLASRKVGYRPFQLALSPDRKSLAVANWGDKSVSLLNAADLKEIARVSVGIHPTDLAFGPDARLFVANAGSNSISVIRGTEIVETILTSLAPGDPVGSTPDAMTVSPDGSRLYVANADNNDIAVIDITNPSRAVVAGFIPTGWYPSALALTPDGKTLIAGVAKGVGSRPNAPGTLPRIGNDAVTQNPDPQHPFDYVGRVMTGYAEIIPVPDTQQLAAYTRQVAANFPQADKGITNAEKNEAEAAFRKIDHVVYIIRENRTYDQVLGDDPRGDGDPALALFGKAVTPNGHRLAAETALLDRYFVNGEVSEDGHEWANAAYATAFKQRATALTYGGRGEPDADERLTDSPAGHLWDAARRKGPSYFSYGEAADFKSSPDTAPIFEGDRGLEGHASPKWGLLIRQFWSDKRQGRDVERATLFIDDLKKAERSGNWPNFIVMSLPEDHTAAFKPGQPTPLAAVASNDLALGQIVEAVSHSEFWSSTAIFVTEDDAQNGPDHVDDHRTVGLVISPYAKPGFIDHTHYTMASMVRTMELILGLPPMTQYDRGATPMYRLFQAEPRSWTYAALSESVDLTALNPQTGPLADASNRLDLSAADRADPDTLNAMLWTAFRPGMLMSAPVRTFGP